MTHEDRGLAVGILGFIAIIIIGAVFYTVMNDGMTQVFSVLDTATTDSDAASKQTLLETIWGAVLWYVLLVAGVFVVARSVFESRRGV